MCKRLFSKDGYGQNRRQMIILPANIESQIFLRAYYSMWRIKDVNAVMTDICFLE